MKKSLLLILVFLIGALNVFALMNVKKVVYDGNVDFLKKDIEKVLSDYDIKDGSIVGDIDLKLAIESIQKKYPYFSYINYKYDEESGELTFTFKTNPVVKKVEFKVLGDKLLDLSKIATKVYTEKELPLNLNEYKKGLGEIQKYYNEQGYPYIEISSNIKISSDSLTLESTMIDKKETDKNTLVYVIKEYDLWDIELKDEISQLDKKELKKEFGFEFRKDWENKFFLFREDSKETYPSMEDMQKIFQKLRELPYFSEKTQITMNATNISKTPGGDLVLVIGGELKKIIEKPEKIKQIKIINNESLKTFELLEQLNKVGISNNATVDNITVLNGIKRLKEYYTNSGYPFVNINTSFENGELIIKILEYKVGNIDINVSPEKKTKDYLINSGIKLKTGKVITTKAIQDTYYALSGTGFFDKVNVYPYAQHEDKIDFKIDITEKNKPGKFVGGITYTMPENAPWYMGFFGQLELQWKNPLGYGQSYNITTNINPLSKTYLFNLGYGITKINNTPLSMKVNFNYGLYDENAGIPEENISGLATVTNKFSIGFSPSYSFNSFNNLNMNLSYSKTEYNSLIIDKKEEISGGLGYTYSRLDYPFRPYNGTYYTLQSFGGLNISNTEEYYYGGYTEFKEFYTLYKFTFADRLKAGYVKDDFNLYDFYIGGMYTVRGYNFSERKGNIMYLNNAEIQYQIQKEAVPVDAYIFFDIGNAGDNLNYDPLWAYGAGIKITLPMIGPVRFEGVFDKENKFKWAFGFGPVF
ncbi:outer membrane protein/protective antigen OMA87 [Marinitoga piezophila KA3]|uniref:Outer membrane protein/protective antigen OMA87 n=1 Tax=Marinitoga piezophila (strain DSM 14283 / JCM 11233 / KA3) TaxID=443254 RepID=H2J6Q7_MARPK|nr:MULTISPECIES: POTRA domain-containing protein [Marinitoga]AEX86338.1 outer membrane protein/protective antigen OMA87 [Marinitoga piezophila KA3]APT76736.1 hypothetical protein LN42_10385 [Marinitoga sp. 1137]NUU98431.1 hypothetical protein [Marinitoga sp. 1138]